MQKGYQPLHSFKVRPKTFQKVPTEYISQSYNANKKGQSVEQPGFFGAIGIISDGKNQPSAENYLRNKAKSEVLARDKGKKHIGRDIKGDKRYQKKARVNCIFQNFIEPHGF